MDKCKTHSKNGWCQALFFWIKVSDFIYKNTMKNSPSLLFICTVFFSNVSAYIYSITGGGVVDLSLWE